MMRLIVLLSCLMLAACGVPRPSALVVPSPFQIDQPFEGAERNEELIGSILETASVVLEPIDGLSGEFNAALMDDVTEAAQDHDIPLSMDREARSADRLRGRFDAVVDRGHGLMGVVSWELETADGEAIDRFQVSAPMRTYSEWDANLFDLDNTTWRTMIAEETASELAAVLDSRPLTARRLAGLPGASNAMGPPVLLSAITGAPGDGNLSLTRAVRALLEQQDVNVINPDHPPEGFDASAAYTLSGTVQVGETDPVGGQPIAISWDLYSPDGAHLGNVAQSNMIEPGSLDGPWGEVAVYAGMGAVEGIMTLLALIPSQEP